MINRKTKSFFIQEMWVDDITISRIEYFKNLLNTKKVLHVGCTDYPIFNPNHNLHLQLQSGKLSLLDGFDIDETGLASLKKYYSGNYYSKIENLHEHYDYILIPEVIEHVDNIQDFLFNMSKINQDRMIITGPCLIGHFENGMFRQNGHTYTEEVHPDHNCWFSPYTLQNQIEKYTKWKIEKIMFLEGKRMVGVIAKSQI